MKLENLSDEKLLKKMADLELKVHDQAHLTYEGAYTLGGEMRAVTRNLENRWWKLFKEIRNRNLWTTHCMKNGVDLFYSFGDLLA